jgi:hypothetical protein
LNWLRSFFKDSNVVSDHFVGGTNTAGVEAGAVVEGDVGVVGFDTVAVDSDAVDNDDDVAGGDLKRLFLADNP